MIECGVDFTLFELPFEGDQFASHVPWLHVQRESLLGLDEAAQNPTVPVDVIGTRVRSRGAGGQKMSSACWWVIGIARPIDGGLASL